MKYLKKFNEDIERDIWSEIISTYDVGQLIELIQFKYGKIIPDASMEFDEYEGDYNPDDIYDVIKSELEASGKYEDFLQNYEAYSIEREESDPFHWRHRKKEMDKFNNSFRDRI